MTEEETKKPDEDQEKEKEEKTEESPIDDIDRANVAAERLEAANKIKSANLDREERLEIKRTLGGKAEAGQKTPKEKEESDIEYKERVFVKGELTDEEQKERSKN